MSTETTRPPEQKRLAALDWARGIVMVLMAIDHASELINSGRLFGDTAFPDAGHAWVAGTALPMAQFLTRWITHLCAPTFVFLAGTSLALSIGGRTRRGDSARAIDLHLLKRGLVILAFEFGYLSAAAMMGTLTFQVLYAIGFGLILMIPLRRLSSPALILVALSWFFFGELISTAFLHPTLVPALAFSPGHGEGWHVLYPVVPWLAMMMLGWAFGRHLLQLGRDSESRPSGETILFWSGVGALLVFVVVRGLNGYGNMLLLRDGASLAQWLHASKYPPSLSYAALELGLMALMICGLMRYERGRRRPPSPNNPITVYGQTALFFYLVHFIVIVVIAISTTGVKEGGLVATYLTAFATLVILYPICRLYRRYKTAHPKGWAQYV